MKALYMSAALTVLLFSGSMYTASAQTTQGIHTPGTGITSPQTKQQGSGQGALISPIPTVSITPTQDQDRLRLFIQEQEQLLDRDRLQLRETEKMIVQNQDRMIVGASVIEQIQKIVPKADPVLSQIAQQIRTATQATIKAEEQLKARNGFIFFLFGSDKNTVRQMEQEVTQNMQRLQKLEQLQQQCPCDEQVKNIFQEQIRLMTQEQQRLQQLVVQEKNNNGILGWAFK